MKKIYLLLITAFILNACTPGIGIGIPLGPVGFAGVGINTNGLHPTAGVRAGPVGVGVSG